MAVMEVPCLNSDRDFKVAAADSGLALTRVYKNRRFSQLGHEFEFFTYLPR